MIDIRRIKDDPAGVKAALRAKEVDCDAAVDRILELDGQRRSLIAETEAMKSEQNKVSKQIPALKKAGEDVAPVFKRMGELKAAIAANDETLRDVEAEYRTCRWRRWRSATRRNSTRPTACASSSAGFPASPPPAERSGRSPGRERTSQACSTGCSTPLPAMSSCG